MGRKEGKEKEEEEMGRRRREKREGGGEGWKRAKRERRRRRERWVDNLISRVQHINLPTSNRDGFSSKKMFHRIGSKDVQIEPHFSSSNLEVCGDKGGCCRGEHAIVPLKHGGEPSNRGAGRGQPQDTESQKASVGRIVPKVCLDWVGGGGGRGERGGGRGWGGEGRGERMGGEGGGEGRGERVWG